MWKLINLINKCVIQLHKHIKQQEWFAGFLKTKCSLTARKVQFCDLSIQYYLYLCDEKCSASETTSILNPVSDMHTIKYFYHVPN